MFLPKDHSQNMSKNVKAQTEINNNDAFLPFSHCFAYKAGNTYMLLQKDKKSPEEKENNENYSKEKNKNNYRIPISRLRHKFTICEQNCNPFKPFFKNKMSNLCLLFLSFVYLFILLSLFSTVLLKIK